MTAEVLNPTINTEILDTQKLFTTNLSLPKHTHTNKQTLTTTIRPNNCLKSPPAHSPLPSHIVGIAASKYRSKCAREILPGHVLRLIEANIVRGCVCVGF